MKSRFSIALFSFVAFTSAFYDFETKRKLCRACIDGVCYGLSSLLQDDRSQVDNFDIDRIDNVIYFAYPYSSKVNSLNLTDKSMNSVLTADHRILGIAVDQTSRDLYYSVQNGDVFKYNLVTKQTASILKPSDKKRASFNNLFISENLYAVMLDNSDNKEYLHERLHEYAPEEFQFKVFQPLKDVHLYQRPMVDKRGDIYFKTNQGISKLQAESKSIVIFHNRTSSIADGVGEITAFGTDKDGVAYFVSSFGLRNLHRLDYNTHEMVMVGIIDSYVDVIALLFDKYNNVIYVDGDRFMHYVTANSERCAIITRSGSFAEIEILPKGTE